MIKLTSFLNVCACTCKHLAFQFWQFVHEVFFQQTLVFLQWFFSRDMSRISTDEKKTRTIWYFNFKKIHLTFSKHFWIIDSEQIFAWDCMIWHTFNIYQMKTTVKFSICHITVKPNINIVYKQTHLTFSNVRRFRQQWDVHIIDFIPDLLSINIVLKSK